MSRTSVLFLLLAATLPGVVACAGGGTHVTPRRHVVEIREFEYHPASLTLSPGDTVVWMNGDAVPHTATAADGAWDSGSIAAGDSWTRIVAEGRSGAYACTFHPSMVGQISVQ